MKPTFPIKSQRGIHEGYKAWFDEQRTGGTVECPFMPGTTGEKNFWKAYHEMERAEEKLCDICGLPLRTYLAVTKAGVETMRQGCGGHIIA